MNLQKLTIYTFLQFKNGKIKKKTFYRGLAMKSIKKLSVLLMLVSFLFCMVLTPISVARAVETNDTVYVKIRYLRPDSNYTDWNLWVWQPDKDGSQVNFIGEDEQGKFAVVEMPKSANSFKLL